GNQTTIGRNHIRYREEEIEKPREWPGSRRRCNFLDNISHLQRRHHSTQLSSSWTTTMFASQISRRSMTLSKSTTVLSKVIMQASRGRLQRKDLMALNLLSTKMVMCPLMSTIPHRMTKKPTCKNSLV